MGSILVPKHVRWDGTKYVADASAEIVDPPGSDDIAYLGTFCTHCAICQKFSRPAGKGK